MIKLARCRPASITQICAALLLTVSCGKAPEKVDLSTFSTCKIPDATGNSSVSITGFPRPSYRLKSTGSVTVTIIMVDFSDAVATKTPDQAYAMLSGSPATFTEMSYGKFTYTLNPVKTWYRMSKPSTSYKFTEGSGHFDYIKEAVALADSAVDFSGTDMIVVLANPDSQNVGNYQGRGPTLPASPGYGLTLDGKEILNFATSAYDLNTWGSIWLTHETGHTLGLVDLYAYETADSSNPYDSLRFTGSFSYMGYNSFDSFSPGLTAWERWTLGWLDDSQMRCANPYKDGTITASLTPVATSGGLKSIVIPVSANKVVVAEQRVPSGIDSKLAKSGVLVYVIDSSVTSGKGAMRVYPSDPKSDPWLKQSPRAAGEFVDVENVRVEVTGLTSITADVRVTALGRL
jgi:M6 family metalloprotease-like protein